MLYHWVVLYVYTATVLCQQFSHAQIDNDQPVLKRRLDRYSFLGTLGKRQDEEISDESDLEDKRALNYQISDGDISKDIEDADDLDSEMPYPYIGYMDKDGSDEKLTNSDSEEIDGSESKRMDAHLFKGMLGKRMRNRMFLGQLGKRGRLDNRMLFAQLGKRGKLNNRMFFGRLGKRLINRMFFGRLGKRMDNRMFAAQLGKRGPLDNRMFFGQLGKRSEPMDKRAYYYRLRGSRGRPIYTQTRGMDRFSFAARLGKRSDLQGIGFSNLLNRIKNVSE